MMLLLAPQAPVRRILKNNNHLYEAWSDGRRLGPQERVVLDIISIMIKASDVPGEYAPPESDDPLGEIVAQIETRLSIRYLGDSLRGSLTKLLDLGFLELTDEGSIRFPAYALSRKRTDGKMDGRSSSSAANGANHVPRKRGETDEEYLVRKAAVLAERRRQRTLPLMQNLGAATGPVPAGGELPREVTAARAASLRAVTSSPNLGDLSSPNLGDRSPPNLGHPNPEIGGEIGGGIGDALGASRAAAAAAESNQHIEKTAAAAAACAPASASVGSLPPTSSPISPPTSSPKPPPISPPISPPASPTFSGEPPSDLTPAERLLQMAVQRWRMWGRQPNLSVLEAMLASGIPFQTIADEISRVPEGRTVRSAAWFQTRFAERPGLVRPMHTALADVPSAVLSQPATPRPEPVSIAGPEGDAWRRVREKLRADLPAAEFGSWIAGLGLVEVEDGRALLHAPSSFVADYVRSTYADRLERFLQAEGQPLRIDVRAGPGLKKTG